MVRYFRILFLIVGATFVYSIRSFVQEQKEIAQRKKELQAFSCKVANATDEPIRVQHTIPANTQTYTQMYGLDSPRAFISSWIRPSHGTTKQCRELDISRPLSTCLRIGFDRQVSQIYVDEFFETLRKTNKLFSGIQPVRHRKFRNEFCLRVGPHYTQGEIESYIEQVNIYMYQKTANKTFQDIRFATSLANPRPAGSSSIPLIGIRVINDSDQFVGTFLRTHGSGDFINPFIVEPNSDIEGLESPKNKSHYITTRAGVFLIHTDNKTSPSKFFLSGVSKTRRFAMSQNNTYSLEQMPEYARLYGYDTRFLPWIIIRAIRPSRSFFSDSMSIK